MKLPQVHNKGIGGQNSAEGRARFPQDVAALQPDFVFIYFGLNDTLNEPKFLTREEFGGNLSWMVEQSLQSGIEPVLCTIHQVEEKALYQRHSPSSYGAEGPNGKINRYNETIRKLAQEKALPLADFFGAALEAGLERIVCPDGVHLTVAGSRLLAETFASVVAGRLTSSVSIVCLGDSVTYGTGLEGEGTITGQTYPAFLASLLSKNLSSLP